MPLLPLIEYEDATPQARAVYDDIMKTRGSNWINNFWKVLANHPETLARVWEDVKTVMKPGALDPAGKGDGLRGGERHQQLRVLHPQPHRGGRARRA